MSIPHLVHGLAAPPAAKGLSLDAGPIWVRPAEACKLLGLGLTKVYELINDGTLESRKVGRARLIRRLDIERLSRR